MPCYHPITAWRAKGKTKNGKTPLVFKRQQGYPHSETKLPCGQCIGCRIERSRQWAIRCLHESQMHKENAFITLTYAEENLPENQSLQIRDYQLFMKKLRKQIYPKKVRFFHCGEYRQPKIDPNTGEIKFGPHYHACLFGHDFKDKQLWKMNDQGNEIYRSAQLEKLWTQGFSSTQDVNYKTAAYVARYIMKKITGEKANEHYQGRQPEYITMSRRPGIGTAWYQKYASDVYPSDEIIINGVQVRPPKFYDQILEATNPNLIKEIKSKRTPPGTTWTAANGTYNPENDNFRLPVKEEVKKCTIKKLKRNMEDSND